MFIFDFVNEHFNKKEDFMSHSVLSGLKHIGFLVEDLDSAVKHFQSLGIGPFEPLKVTFVRREVLGKPITDSNVKLKIRIAQMGQIQYELIEPGEGKSPWRDYLETHGEGIEHIGFFVEDIDAAVAEMEKEGFRVLRRGWFEGGGGNAFIDTNKVGGTNIELIQWPEK
jgi:methylmalonyl-CoA/ethylmalonyl-CoA epimerase